MSSPRLDAALSYLDRGWAPIPVPLGEKAPTIHGWPKLRISEADAPSYFPAGAAGNIGLILGPPSGDLVDVDLDCAEAIALADTILPATGMVHGRASKRRSHRWYVAEGAETEKWQGVHGAMLVELRSTGGQTIVPPSVHPSGEAVQWEQPMADPAKVDAAELRMAVARLAAATLLARHWPAQGSRDEAAMALCGGLLRARWPTADVDRFVEAVATAAGDEEAAKRAKAEATAEKIAADKATTGWTHLSQLLVGDGAKSVARVREWLGLPDTTRSAAEVETVVVQTMDSIQPERVHWLWRGRVAFGKLNLIEGDPGRGKSLITVEIAARLTHGEPLPGDDGRKLEPADVLIVSAEDGVADTIVPRLMAASADMARVHTVRIKDRDLERLPELTPPDLARIEEAVRKTGAKLIVLDPLMAFLPGKIDSKIDHHVRRALAPLAILAEKTGVAVVVIRHWNKTAAGRAIYRGGGSIGIAGAARSVLVVAEDPDDKRRRVLASVKCNIAAPVPSLLFEIVTDYVDQAGQQIETARVVWAGESSHTADELAATPENPEEKSRLVEAMDFLRVVLAGGPRLATEVKAEAREVGISSKTLWVARRRLGVRARKRLGPKAPWEWWLPTPGRGSEEVEAKLSLCPHVESMESLENMESFPHDQSTKGSKDSNSSKDSKIANDCTDLDHVEPQGEADTTFDFGANVATPSTEMPPPPPSEIAGAKTLREVVGYYLDHGVLDAEAIMGRIAGLRDAGEALPYPWSDAALAERVPQIAARIAERREREAYYRRLHHLPEGASP